METLTQPEEPQSGSSPEPTPLTDRIQAQLTKTAYLTLHHHAKDRRVPIGRVLSELIEAHLAAVRVAA